MINAIQEALVPVGQTCVYNRAEVFGEVTPTRECGPNGQQPSMDFHMRNTTFISSMVLSVACVSAANAGVVDPFTEGSTVSNPDGNFVETPITGGLWDTRSTYVAYTTSNASVSLVVNAITNAATATINQVGTTSTSRSQEFAIEYLNYAGATDVSNFTSLTFDYTSTMALTLAVNVGGKTVYNLALAAAVGGGTFSMNASVLSGTVDGSYLNLLFSRLNSNASGSFTMTNLVANGIPAPGAVALLGAAGLIGARRRRD